MFINNSLVNRSNILFFYPNETSELIFNKKNNLDVYIVNTFNPITFRYLDDKQNYIFIEDYASLKEGIDKNNITNFYLINIISDDNKQKVINILKNEMTDFDIVEEQYFNPHPPGQIIVELMKK